MTRKRINGIATVAVLLTTAAGAYALTGARGATATELFTEQDVLDDVTYDTGFSGAEWTDLQDFQFGTPTGTSHALQSNDLAADADGDLYLLVHGADYSANSLFTGLVHYDGTGFRTVLQDVHIGGATTEVGDLMRTVEVSPVTVGRLTAGHPILTRQALPASGGVFLEIVSVDPTTAPATETLVYDWETTALNPEIHVVIDDDGVIYALELGLRDANGVVNANGSIRKLVWNSGTSEYDETILTTDTGNGLALGPDGTLYTCRSSDDWGTTSSSHRDILAVDPVTGVTSVYAKIHRKVFAFDWAWSGSKFWIGEDKSNRKNRRRYVTDIRKNKVTKYKRRISNSSNRPDSLAAAPDGDIFVMEGGSGDDGAVFLLSP